MEDDGQVIGYGVLMIGVGEGHLLNLSIARAMQRVGLGRRLLAHFLALARSAELDRVLLEVRPSNLAARRLYASEGFREVHLRRGYYPARQGREDAILMTLVLSQDRGVE
jgi:ribosomal-protein-alanine N-acetyltransferase